MQIRVAATIRRARPEVAAVMFDPLFAPAWIGGVVDTRRLSHDAAFERVIRSFGRERTEVIEISLHVPNRSVTVRSRAATHRFALERVPEGAVAWIEVQTQPTGLARACAPLFRMLLRRAALRDLRRLKRLMESGEDRSWRQTAPAPPHTGRRTA